MPPVVVLERNLPSDKKIPGFLNDPGVLFVMHTLTRNTDNTLYFL